MFDAWYWHWHGAAAAVDTAAVSGTGLTIPATWSAHTMIMITETKLNSTMVNYHVDYAQDDMRKRSAMFVPSVKSYAPLKFVGTPLEWVNTTTYVTDNFGGRNINGNTQLSPVQYQDMFSWTRAATCTPASDLVTACTLQMSSSMSYVGHFTTATLAPVSVTIKLKVAEVESVINVQFLTWEKGNTGDDLWRGFDKTDYTDPHNCTLVSERDETSVVETDMYLFHPAHNFEIQGQDLADVAGDTTFTCITSFANQTGGGGAGDYEWYSKWRVTHAATFGQYQLCNGYDPPVCTGENNQWVGHQAAWYFGMPFAGQCQMNPGVGEWYSLPVGGQCKDGQTVGVDCTWRAERIKTIDAKCLFSHDFVEACTKDARVPFESAQGIFTRAFEHSDPASGGCAPLPGP